MPHYSRLIVLSALCATALAVENSTTHTTDADLGPRVIGGYIPKKGPSLVALVLYGISALVQWIQYFTVTPRRPFILWLTCGMTAMALGFVLRIIFANEPSSMGRYIAMDLFILLSPCLFLATDYMILSHLVRIFDEEIAEKCMLIRPTLIVRLFVWSDVSTFLLQSTGGGLTAMKDVNLANIGNKIAEVGIILQAVSFLLFTIVFVVFGIRIQKHFPEVWRPRVQEPFRLFSREPIEDWRILFYVTSLTCIGILIRSVFRIVEFVGGYNGMVFTHEGYFYVLDALPLWIAMTLYCFVWPIRVFNHTPVASFELKKSSPY
ncbi:hypothetical protein MIND_00853100 [Mycena indigotica]|uniref:RTA1-domain-containing protein n=1 Tax=Mycena indigotica TaxID=2126181 RepID=A0A8H6SHH5_9AGAR|nr:uncharacterized protein MIND_00853100 [Mycena indigotica]KAF7299048.1 hypothetical protein MIND_00853100 [Mycena indigotica]